MYIFNYGAPIAIINVDDDHKRIIVYTDFNDSEIIKGMATVASLIRKYNTLKFFILKNYTGYMGKEYIAVAYTDNPIYSPSIFGFLMRMIRKLDEKGLATVSYVVNMVLETLKKENGKDFKIIYKGGKGLH